jgi:hypothetical protein
MARVAIEPATDLGEPVEVPAPSLPEITVPPAGGAGPPAGIPGEFADWVDFAPAGSDVTGEFRCADCGYGAVVQRVLPPCPMCRGTVWERREPLAARFQI